MTDEPRDPLATLLDLTVYAPLGAALHGPEAVDELAARGRQDVTNARFIGQAVIGRGRRELDRFAADAQERVTELLLAAARAAGGTIPGQEPAAEHTAADPAGPADDEAAPPEPEAHVSHLSVVGPDAAPDVATLAIPDYDNLSASQVVPRLDDLGDDELRAVDDYERAHRGRMTILSRIAQLRAS